MNIIWFILLFAAVISYQHFSEYLIPLTLIVILIVLFGAVATSMGIITWVDGSAVFNLDMITIE